MKLKQKTQQLASGIAGDMTNAFKSVIDGTKSVEDAFADMLQSIANRFLDMAMEILQDAITKQLMNLFSNLLGSTFGGVGGGGGSVGKGAFIGGFADGGRPPVGEVSLVGERGPELFVPDQPGRIYSNEQSRAMLDQYSSNQSVSAAPMTATVNYNGPTMNFNGDDYVPRSAISEIINTAAKQGAEAGEMRVMSSLRNRRSSRSRIGLR